MLQYLSAFSLITTFLTVVTFGREYPLDSQGFVHHWVFTGAKATPVPDEAQKADAVFKAFRSEEVPFTAPTRFEEIGKVLPNGMALLPGGQRDKLFLDDYKFHRTLCRLEGYAVTALVTPRPVEVKVRWWTGWGQIQAWVQGKPVHTAAHFKSQPASATGTIRLEAGTNLVFIRRIGMGQRNQVFETGLQILEAPASLTVSVPGDPGQVSSYFEAEAWIADLKSTGPCQFTSDIPSPSAVSVFWDRKTLPWPPGQTQFLWPVTGGEETPQGLRIDLALPGATLSRTIDWLSRSPIVYPPTRTLDAHRAALMEQTTRERTSFWGLFRGFQWMSRLRGGADVESAEMKGLINQMTTAIGNRDGTSDFQLAAALRLLNVDGSKLPGESRSALKACLLDFRYWEDEKGTDTLSFSSENHQVLLHSSQLLAGLLYPDDTFARSGRTGAAQAEVALKRLDDWLTLREKEGLQEFLAPAYHGETAVALLNLFDFAPRDGNIPPRAKTVLDHLFRLSARHSLGGLTLGANGRCYRRELLPPQTQPRQAFLSWAVPEVPFAVVPQLMALHTSKYVMPEDLAALSRKPGEETFREGGTVLYMKKQQEYLLSSSTLPVPEEASGPWSRDFVPGSFCYQAHLWELSLGGHARIFVTHPGSTSELLDARPGYWVGEGTAPMLKAEAGQVFEIYRLSPEHPVAFTHAWFPSNSFDETRVQGHWAFARKGDGYGALWCSEVLVPYDQAAVGCELRASGRFMAWYAKVGSKSEDGSFPSFMEKTRALGPAFIPENGELTVGGKVVLTWRP